MSKSATIHDKPPSAPLARGSPQAGGDGPTRAGLGIGELATHIAAGTPELVRIWPEREQSYEVYLVMHSDLNRSARVRAAADAIIESFPR